MLEEYFSYKAEMVPEARRAFALTLAASSTHEHMTSADIMDRAKLFDDWLKEVAAPETAGAKLKVAK